MDADRRSDAALDLAGALAIKLGTAAVYPLHPEEGQILDAAKSFRFGPDGSRLAWSIGKGRLVVLAHGFGGRGAQMIPLAQRLSTLGFRCVLFDAGGHGASRSEKVGFHTFMNDTRDLIDHMDEPVYALLGHSAGALAMMRARALYGVEAERYVLISALLFPYIPLEMMRKNGAPEATLDHVKAILSDQFQTSWSSLAAGEAYIPESGKPLLAIWDAEDARVDQADSAEIAKQWTGARAVKTEGFGHNRILQAEPTLSAVSEFLLS